MKNLVGISVALCLFIFLSYFCYSMGYGSAYKAFEGKWEKDCIRTVEFYENSELVHSEKWSVVSFPDFNYKPPYGSCIVDLSVAFEDRTIRIAIKSLDTYYFDEKL